MRGRPHRTPQARDTARLAISRRSSPNLRSHNSSPAPGKSTMSDRLHHHDVILPPLQARRKHGTTRSRSRTSARSLAAEGFGRGSSGYSRSPQPTENTVLPIPRLDAPLLISLFCVSQFPDGYLGNEFASNHFLQAGCLGDFQTSTLTVLICGRYRSTTRIDATPEITLGRQP